MLCCYSCEFGSELIALRSISGILPCAVGLRWREDPRTMCVGCCHTHADWAPSPLRVVAFLPSSAVQQPKPTAISQKPSAACRREDGRCGSLSRARHRSTRGNTLCCRRRMRQLGDYQSVSVSAVDSCERVDYLLRHSRWMRLCHLCHV